jgi:DNA-binding transcriptional LysR family regulator
MTTPDLNDFRLFVHVVDAGGFAAAARKLGMPRSRVSRRIAQLEEQLGVRLIHRSTRAFSVTDIGREFHRHATAMLVEADAASAVIAREHQEPQGLVRVACPSSLIQFQVGPMISRFLAQYPRIEVQLESTNRRVDILREGFDLAIRVRFPPLEDSDLVVRRLGADHQHLVAAPTLLDRARRELGRDILPADLPELPSLAWEPDRVKNEWQLIDPDGHLHAITHSPRFVTQDMSALLDATISGAGVARLPAVVAQDHLTRGEIVEVLPGWRPRSGIIHLVFPTRRGLIPSVRALIEHLADGFAKALARIEKDASRHI